MASNPAETWFAVRHFDLYQLRYVRALFRLRGASETSATLEDIVAPGNGFRCLAEDEGRFFVAGAIDKFWHRHIPFVQVDPKDFAASSMSSLRVRADLASEALARLAGPFLNAVHSVMESAQLRQLKSRAEALSQV